MAKLRIGEELFQTWVQSIPEPDLDQCCCDALGTHHYFNTHMQILNFTLFKDNKIDYPEKKT